MIRVAIAEDNIHERMILKKMLERIEDVELMIEATSAEELIEQVEISRPDVIFLDIELPGMTGLEAASEITDINPKSFIIFATSFTGYTKEAFDVYAFDYLVKPYHFDRLQKTMNRIRIIRGMTEGKLSSDSQLEDLADHQNGLYTKILIQGDDCLHVLNRKDITMITRNDRKTEIHSDHGIVKTNETLEKVEKKLGEGFFRSHKGFIVNEDKITEIHAWGEKTFLIKLSDTCETALITSDKLKSLKRKWSL